MEHQQFYTFVMMHLTASAVSEKLLSFTGWLVTGFAAIVGLIVTNIDKVSPFICETTIGTIVKLFAATVLVHLFQRYFSLMVSASAKMALTTRDLPAPIPFDGTQYIKDFSSGMYSLPRMYLNRVISKMNANDPLYGPRMSLKLSQWQTVLVLVQSILAIWAVWLIADSL